MLRSVAGWGEGTGCTLWHLGRITSQRLLRLHGSGQHATKSLTMKTGCWLSKYSSYRGAKGSAFSSSLVNFHSSPTLKTKAGLGSFYCPASVQMKQWGRPRAFLSPFPNLEGFAWCSEAPAAWADRPSRILRQLLVYCMSLGKLLVSVWIPYQKFRNSFNSW